MADFSEAEDFDPYLGQAFHLEDVNQALSLEEVERAPPIVALQRNPFTLIFRGPKPGQVVAEGLHPFRTEDGAAGVLYLMPIHTPAADHQDYQCIFN